MKNHHFQFKNQLIKLYLTDIFLLLAGAMLKFRRFPVCIHREPLACQNPCVLSAAVQASMRVQRSRILQLKIYQLPEISSVKEL